MHVSPFLKHPKKLLVALCAISSFSMAGAQAQSTQSWPAESSGNATELSELSDDFTDGDISGAYWNARTNTLWVSDNKEEKVFSLIPSGSSFRIDKQFTVRGDHEGITQALDDDIFYIIDEDTSVIRAYSTSDGDSLGEWDIADDIAEEDDGQGPEGLTFVPNEWLNTSGFRDNSGNTYRASQNDLGGIFFVAHQNGGSVFALDLASNGSHDFVGEYETLRDESSGLEFDASTGKLYISHNTDGNTLEVTSLASTARNGHRAFIADAEFRAPNSSNLEGFAITPAVNADGTIPEIWAFYTDDEGDDGAILWFRDLQPSLTVIEGNNQTADAGESVDIQPVVSVSDRFENDIPGVNVVFSVSEGGGNLSASRTQTNDMGEASLGDWILGRSGNQQVTASAGSISTTINASINGSSNTGGNDGGSDGGSDGGTDGGSDGGTGGGVDGGTSGGITVSASSSDGNGPSNATDGNPDTRWSARGDGEYLQLQFESAQNISGVDIAFFRGDERSANFDLQTSSDGINWVTQLSGQDSSGRSDELEFFPFNTSVAATFVRFVGHGNNASSSSSAQWNSIIDIEVRSDDRPTPTPTPTTTPTPTPTPTTAPPETAQVIIGLSVTRFSAEQSTNRASNLFDGDTGDSTGERWSAMGLNDSSQWVVLDLGDTYSITETTLYAFQSRDYQYLIQLSSNPNSGFNTILDRSNNTTSATSITDSINSNVTGRYLRLEVLGGNSYTGNWSSINELELKGIQQ